MEQAEYELYAQHNGVNYLVLRLLRLMSYKQGAEGQVHACQVQEIINEDKFLHLKIKVGEIVAIKVLEGAHSVITYRNTVTYPKLITTQINSIKKTGNDFGFVKHLAEMLSTKEVGSRSSQKVEKVVILMEYVPFTCADLFSKSNDVEKSSDEKEPFIYNYCVNPNLPFDTRKPYPGGVLRVGSSIIKDLKTTTAVDRVFAACSFIEDLALSLQNFHYMQVNEKVDVTSRHRDLRLPNLGMRQDGSLIILDPGLVLLVESMSQGFGSTGYSTFNVGYNSPHVILSNKEGTPTYGYADDWFQLAVSIVRILVGEYPFKGTNHIENTQTDIYANSEISFYQFLQEKLSSNSAGHVINEIMKTNEVDKYFYDGFVSILHLLHDPENPLESSGPLLLLLGQGYKNQEERSEALLQMVVSWRQTASHDDEYIWEQKLRKDTVRKCIYYRGKKTEVHMWVNDKINDACGQPGIIKWAGERIKYEDAEYEKLCQTLYQEKLYTPILWREHFKDGEWYGYGDVDEATAEIYWIPQIKEKLTPSELHQRRTGGPVRKRWEFKGFDEVKYTEYDAQKVEEDIIMPESTETYKYLEFIKNSVVVDVGGSGAKFAGCKKDTMEVFTTLKIESIEEFFDQISRVRKNPKMVVVSMAGYVNSTTGIVHFSRNAPWAKGNLVEKIEKHFEGCKAYVVHDGEAHVLATQCMENIQLGVLGVSIGTSLGLGILNGSNEVLRPCSGENWDVGSLVLKTRAPYPEVWWALGSEGLQQLQETMGEEAGTVQFGYRLGAFLAELSIIFRPRSIVLSGGVINKNWETMAKAVKGEMRVSLEKAGVLMPKVEKSPFTQAALVGAEVILDKFCFEKKL